MTLLTTLESDRISVIDVAPYFLDPDSSIAFETPNGKQLFQDRYHISPYGAELILDDLLNVIKSAYDLN